MSSWREFFKKGMGKKARIISAIDPGDPSQATSAYMATEDIAMPDGSTLPKGSLIAVDSVPNNFPASGYINVVYRGQSSGTQMVQPLQMNMAAGTFIDSSGGASHISTPIQQPLREPEMPLPNLKPKHKKKEPRNPDDFKIEE